MTQTGVRTNIFGIGEVYELQREGQWVEKGRETYREYGYVAGGMIGASYEPGYNATTSIVDRIDFSNDTATASIRGGLSVPRINLGASGNSNFGYWGGGYAVPPVPGARTNVDRIDYSNDISTTSRRGDLAISMQFGSAVCNTNFGYFSQSSFINRINYANDLSTASQRGSLTRYFARHTGRKL